MCVRCKERKVKGVNFYHLARLCVDHATVPVPNHPRSGRSMRFVEMQKRESYKGLTVSRGKTKSTENQNVPPGADYAGSSWVDFFCSIRASLRKEEIFFEEKKGRGKKQEKIPKSKAKKINHPRLPPQHPFRTTRIVFNERLFSR